MTVKEVVALAAGCLGREDLAAALDKNQSGWTAEETEELKALLRCYNFVESEIALDYCALKREETVGVVGNKITYSSLSRTPFRIRKVVCGGSLARFTAYPDYILVSDGWKGNAKVVYDCIPNSKTAFTSVSDFTGTSVTARVMACGIAAQYCLVNGESNRSALWERKFRDGLNAVNLFRRTVRVRSRRWV